MHCYFTNFNKYNILTKIQKNSFGTCNSSFFSLRKLEILNDKTMDDKLVHVPNGDKKFSDGTNNKKSIEEHNFEHNFG